MRMQNDADGHNLTQLRQPVGDAVLQRLQGVVHVQAQFPGAAQVNHPAGNFVQPRLRICVDECLQQAHRDDANEPAMHSCAVPYGSGESKACLQSAIGNPVSRAPPARIRRWSRSWPAVRFSCRAMHRRAAQPVLDMHSAMRYRTDQSSWCSPNSIICKRGPAHFVMLISNKRRSNTASIDAENRMTYSYWLFNLLLLFVSHIIFVILHCRCCY